MAFSSAGCYWNLNYGSKGDDVPDSRASTYLEDGQRVWRASSFGYCEQYLTRVALGQTPAAPPQFMLDAYAAGVDAEPDILAQMSSFGWRMFDHHDLRDKMNHVGKLDTTGQLNCELKVPGGVIRCHPDGVAECFSTSSFKPWDLGQRAVVEIKALKKGSWAKPLEHYAYAWQGSIEAAVTGLPLLFVVGWKDDDGLIWKDDKLDLELFYVENLPHSKGAIMARAARLNRLVRDAEEGKGLVECNFKMFPCGFWQEHDKAAGSIWHDAKLEIPEDKEEELRALAAKYRDAADKEAEGKKIKKKLGPQIKKIIEGLGAKPSDKFVTAMFDYLYVESFNTGYDAEAAKKDGVDLEKYKVSTPYTYVKVDRHD